MSNGFNKRYPEFASIENHIRRAQAERAVTIANWIAEAIVGAARVTRDMLSRSAVARLPRASVVAKVSLPR